MKDCFGLFGVFAPMIILLIIIFIKSIWMKYVYLILLIFVMSYREVQILIDRGNWKKENLRFNPYWYLPQDRWYKNFDSYHSSNGLAVLIICYFVASYIASITMLIGLSGWGGLIIDTALYWVVFFQLRNLAMYAIYKREK